MQSKSVNGDPTCLEIVPNANGGDSESPDFLHQISIYTDIIESPNLQYLNMQIIKSPGSKWKNPHPHFFQNPQISRF